MTIDTVFGGSEPGDPGTESVGAGSKESVRPALVIVVTLLVVLAVWMLLWGLLNTFDPYGPSVTEQATITSSERVRRTCSNSSNVPRSTRQCYRYEVSGRSVSGDEWSFESKDGVDALDRGDSVVVERSTITGRVIGLNAGGFQFDAQTSLRDRGLALVLLLTGGGLSWFMFGMTGELGRWRPVVIVIGVVGAVCAVAALHVDPVSGNSRDDSNAARSPSTEAAPATASSEVETTTTTMLATTTTTEAETTTTAAETTTTEPSLTEGSADDLLAAFFSAQITAETTSQDFVHTDDAGTFNATISYPRTWTVEQTDDDPYRLELVQPESEFSEFQAGPERIRLTAWRRTGADFAEQVDGFLINSSDDDEEVFGQGRTTEGRWFFAAQNRSSQRVIRTRYIIDADTHIAAFDLYHQPEDTAVVEILAAVAASASFS